MSPWLHLCFLSPGSARGRLEQLAYGDKPGLNLTNIRELVLPVPPLEEQRRIVAKVGQLMALVDELEMQLMASRTKAAKLLSALVAELTSQTAGALAGTGWQSTRRRSDSLSDRAI
jgi:type I restriction enzyme S subunit